MSTTKKPQRNIKYAMERLMRDLRELQQNPLSTIHAAPLQDNFLEWHANLLAPKSSAYCGCVFHLRLIFDENYPIK